MKKMLLIAIAMLLCFAFTSFAGDEGHEGHAHAQSDAPWFDMQNCDFCKNLVKDEKLMENMIWEHHDISNGIVTITTVNPDYKPAYMEAMEAMMQLGTDLETGKCNIADVKMCNYCKNYGMLMEAGAKFDYVMGQGADLTIITSDNPETIEKIKKFGERNRMELAKLEKAESTK